MLEDNQQNRLLQGAAARALQRQNSKRYLQHRWSAQVQWAFNGRAWMPSIRAVVRAAALEPTHLAEAATWESSSASVLNSTRVAGSEGAQLAAGARVG